ncbi:hypothetical protein BKA65DRAFT_96008 [Rhexocercosporidium sp. MPI-PUGE-AT-0058]|nr:hypothetical protein BKA65DRAFT_96008 [Rhexocercosporidium sp. MPI-PUGE-AT-0058]
MFALFPKLPAELRIKVWKRARERRIVEVRWDSSSGFHASSHPPALRSVCKESRDVILPIQSKSERHLLSLDIKFDPTWDVLYFPYPSQCSLSYGLSLRTFLRTLDLEIRHLALCVPLLDPRLEANIEALRHHSGLDTQEARGRNSTTFFSSIQSTARQAGDLNLETLTIITNDPFMRKLSDHDLSHESSVIRAFKKIAIYSEDEEQLWAARAEYFRWRLTQPHDVLQHRSIAGVIPQPEPQCTWGTPRVEFRTGERNYVHRDVTEWCEADEPHESGDEEE